MDAAPQAQALQGAHSQSLPTTSTPYNSQDRTGTSAKSIIFSLPWSEDLRVFLLHHSALARVNDGSCILPPSVVFGWCAPSIKIELLTTAN